MEYHINIIKSKPDAGILKDIFVCNVLELSQFDENSFDVILCMGAIYHLSSKELREKAVSECTRVCKPGGIVALTYVIGTLAEKYRDIFFLSDRSEYRGDSVKIRREKKT